MHRQQQPWGLNDMSSGDFEVTSHNPPRVARVQGMRAYSYSDASQTLQRISHVDTTQRKFPSADTYDYGNVQSNVSTIGMDHGTDMKIHSRYALDPRLHCSSGELIDMGNTDVGDYVEPNLKLGRHGLGFGRSPDLNYRPSGPVTDGTKTSATWGEISISEGPHMAAGKLLGAGMVPNDMMMNYNTSAHGHPSALKLCSDQFLPSAAPNSGSGLKLRQEGALSYGGLSHSNYLQDQGLLGSSGPSSHSNIPSLPSRSRSLGNPPTDLSDFGISDQLAIMGLPPPTKEKELANVHTVFWDLCHRMFCSTVDIRSSHSATTKAIEDMCSLLTSISTPSPLLAVALDVMVAKCGVDIIGKIPKDNTVKTPSASEQMKQTKKSIENILYTMEEKVCKAVRSHSEGWPMFCEKVINEHLGALAALDSSDILIPTSAEIYALVKRNATQVKLVDDALMSMSSCSMLGSDWERVSESTRRHFEGLISTHVENPSVYTYGAAVTGLSSSEATGELRPTVDMTVNFTELEDLDLKTYTSKVGLLKQVRSWKIHVHDYVVRKDALGAMSDMLTEMHEIISRLSNSDLKMTIEGDAFLAAGNQYVNYVRNVLAQELTQPSVANTFKRINSAKQQMQHLDEKVLSLKRLFVVGVEKSVIESSYDSKRVSSKGGELAYECTDREKTSCRLTIGKPIFVHTSMLMASYLSLDKTGKVYGFVSLVRRFVHAHGLTAELSSYAWTVMAIHCLLRFGFLPNISMNYPNSAPPRSQKVYCCGIDVTVRRHANITGACEKKLSEISMIELLFIFFHYYAVRADVIGSVFTLRANGDVLPKSVWHYCTSTKLWRLSVEDPFEYAGSESQRDLASRLTFDGQTRIFDLLRQGLYASVYIIKATAFAPDATLLSAVHHLMNSQKLKMLSRQGEEGDRVSTPVWNPKAVPPGSPLLQTPSLDSSLSGTFGRLSVHGDMHSSVHSTMHSSVHSLGCESSDDTSNRASTHSSQVIDEMGADFWNDILKQYPLQDNLHNNNSNALKRSQI